jgi:hypothetical protein
MISVSIKTLKVPDEGNVAPLVTVQDVEPVPVIAALNVVCGLLAYCSILPYKPRDKVNGEDFIALTGVNVKANFIGGQEVCSTLTEHLDEMLTVP